MLSWAFAVLGVLCLLAGPAGAQTVEIPLDDDFWALELNWRGGGEMLILYTARPIGGRTFVCGLYIIDGPVPLAVANAYVREARVKAGSKTLISNLSFFPHVDAAASVRRVRAKCRASRVPWSDAIAQARLTIAGPKLVEY